MERIKGMVLELKGRRAIILTTDGDFCEVPAYRPDWEIGQCIEVPVHEPIALEDHRPASAGSAVTTGTRRRRRLRWSAAAVTAAAILAVFLMFGPWAPVSPQPAYAAVSVDLYNGSYRLYVDADQRVVSAAAASTEGMELLRDSNYKGQPLDQVIELLVRQAVTDGELQPDRPDQVVLMSASVLKPDSPDAAGGVAKLKKGLEKASQKGQAKLKARDVDAPVAVLTVTSPSLQDRASELGLSVNEYLVLLKARDLGLDLTLKDMRGKRYVARLRKQGVSIEELLADIQDEDDLAELSARHHEQLIEERDKKGNDASDGDTIVEVQQPALGSGQDGQMPSESDGVLSEPGTDQEPGAEAVVPPVTSNPDDSGVLLPGDDQGSSHGQKDGHDKFEPAEDKVGRWLKKLHPPGLFKEKHNKNK